MNRRYLLDSTFKIYDVDKSGGLNQKEFCNLLTHYSKNMRFTDITVFKAIFLLLDTHIEKELSFKQVSDWWYGKGESLKLRLLSFRDVLMKGYKLFNLFAKDDRLTFIQFDLMGKYIDVEWTREDFIIAGKRGRKYLNFQEFMDYLGWL